MHFLDVKVAGVAKDCEGFDGAVSVPEPLVLTNGVPNRASVAHTRLCCAWGWEMDVHPPS